MNTSSSSTNFIDQYSDEQALVEAIADSICRTLLQKENNGQQRIDLHKIYCSQKASLYTLSSGLNIETVIASTPQVAELLNTPEICGIEFQTAFSKALLNIIEGLYINENFRIARLLKQYPLDVLYILRGGLNFDIHKSLSEITDTPTEVSFISSQRVETGSKDFSIGESNYRKWSIQNDAIVCIGDISATATTLRHTIDLAISQYAKEEKKPKGLLIFTIGTSTIKEVLDEYDKKLRRVWGSTFQGITLVFLEGIFYLYRGDVALLSSTHLPFTDFFRKDFPVAIEFERKCLMTPSCFMERCAIYDGGSRAFEPKLYLNNLQKYWKSIGELSYHLDLIDLVSLKSNLTDYQHNFTGWIERRPWWNNIEEYELRTLHQQGQEALATLKTRSIAEVAHKRLTEINERSHRVQSIQNDFSI